LYYIDYNEIQKLASVSNSVRNKVHRTYRCWRNVARIGKVLVRQIWRDFVIVKVIYACLPNKIHWAKSLLRRK